MTSVAEQTAAINGYVTQGRYDGRVQRCGGSAALSGRGFEHAGPARHQRRWSRRFRNRCHRRDCACGNRLHALIALRNSDALAAIVREPLLA